MAYLFSNHSFSPPSVQNESAQANPEHYCESWKHKFIDYWSSHDTLFWLLSELYKLQVQNPATLKLEQFVHTRGCDLKKFTKEDFRKIIPQYGDLLFHQLQMKLRSVTDEVWRREMVSRHLYASAGAASSSSALPPPPEPFNMAYFDHLPPSHLVATRSSTSTSAGGMPKHLPPDGREYECWAYKRLLEWTPRDTIDCVIHELFQLNINPSSVNLDRFQEVYGCDLAKMTLEDFKLMLPEYGDILYSRLQPKIKSNLKSEMPWKLTQDSQVFSRHDPLSYAHRQEYSYAHPSCFRWEPDRSFTGYSSDDSVLNLSRECTSTSTSALSGGNIPLEGSSSELSCQSQSLFDQSSTFKRVKSSTSSASNFSISSLTKSGAECTSTVVKQESESDTSLNVVESELVKEVTKESKPSPCHIKDSEDTQDSCSSEGKIKPQDSQKDSVISTADMKETKGYGFYSENSGADPGYDSESNGEMDLDEEVEKTVVEKRRPGRPRSLNKKDKTKGKVGRVWEFIRDLIMDPRYNPSVISWEDREKGLFRFRSGDQVAKLWGCKRGNPRMNFENFSRSIRQNYKKGYLLPVEKVRLVYQFGPRSTGWRTGDPPTRPISLPTAPAPTKPASAKSAPAKPASAKYAPAKPRQPATDAQ